MELDVWTYDILNAIKKINGKFEKSHCILANSVIIKLLKSDIFKGAFDGVCLEVLNDDSGYSCIKIPEWNDPLNDSCNIRSESTFNAFGFMFDIPMYSEEEYETWDYDKNSAKTYYSEPKDIEGLQDLILELSLDSYYSSILTSSFDSTGSDLNISIYKEDCAREIINDTRISRYNYGFIRDMFGHRYFNDVGNRIVISLSNDVGPIGLAGLFDHSRVPNGDDSDLFSLSYISVMPGYRGQGNAYRLLDAVFEYCKASGKMLSRTEPTEIGRNTAPRFSAYASKVAPDLPFMTRVEVQGYRHIRKTLPGFSKFSYKKKCSVVQGAMRRIRAHEAHSYGMSDAQCQELERYLDGFSAGLEP